MVPFFIKHKTMNKTQTRNQDTLSKKDLASLKKLLKASFN